MNGLSVMVSPESKPGSVIEWQKKTITEPKWETYPYTFVADQLETNMVFVNWRPPRYSIFEL